MTVIQEQKKFEVYADGITCRYRGQLHSRNDKPAIEYPDGSKYWYKDGVMHREDGPAVLVKNAEIWMRDGKYHRIDGPAVSWTIKKRYEYWVDGLQHRDDGPAIIDPVKGDEWWQRGERVSP